MHRVTFISIADDELGLAVLVATGFQFDGHGETGTTTTRMFDVRISSREA